MRAPHHSCILIKIIAELHNIFLLEVQRNRDPTHSYGMITSYTWRADESLQQPKTRSRSLNGEWLADSLVRDLAISNCVRLDEPFSYDCACLLYLHCLFSEIEENKEEQWRREENTERISAGKPSDDFTSQTGDYFAKLWSFSRYGLMMI